MKAIFKTASNYGNLNGKELDVIEIAGTRISCSVFSNEFNKDVTVDFCLSELVRFEGVTKIPVIMGLLPYAMSIDEDAKFTIHTLFECNVYYLVFKDKRNGFEICRIPCDGKDVTQLRNFKLIYA